MRPDSLFARSPLPRMTWFLPVAHLLSLLPGCANQTPNTAAQGLLFQVAPAREASPATSPMEAIALYQGARHDLEAGEQVAAIAKLRRARQLDPSHLDSANVLAVLLAEAGDLTGALAQLQAVLAIRHDDAVATANLVLVAGRLAARRGKAGAVAADNRAAATAATTSAVPPTTIRSANTVVRSAEPVVGESKSASAKKTGGGATGRSGGVGGVNPAPTPARIEFRNSTTVNGLALRLSRHCASGLFVERIRVANWGNVRLLQSEIQYRAGHETEATETARRLGLPSSALHEQPGLGDGIDLRILIGTDMARHEHRAACSGPVEGMTNGSAPANGPSFRS